MYSGKLVFAQVMEFAPWHIFRRLVAKYRGDVGTQDQFGFGKHYDNFIAMLQSKGLTVNTRDDFPANCVDIAKLPERIC